MRLLTRAALLAVSAAAVLAGSASASAGGAGSATAPAGDVVGYVYVNDNTAGTNTIAGFARHADGSLSALPGSPFSAGGAGTGASIGSQGALQQSANGRYLLAVDAGSNQISVLRIRADGTLRLIEHGVTGSGGAEPVSIAVHDNLVYVANAGRAGTDYTGFRLGREGRLRPIAGSTFALPDHSQPGDVLFNGTGSNLVGVRVNGSVIDSFAVKADGTLKPAPGSPFKAQGPGPFGSEFRPTNPNQLFVSNAHGGPNAGTVSAFRVSGDGSLASIGSSPFADNQTAPCWIEITHDGRFLFTVNTASASISRYAIEPAGGLRLLGSTPLSGPSGLSPFDARLSPDGQFLWVVDSGLPGVSALKVSGGNLTELSSSPTSLPAGAKPFGIVVK